MWFHAALLGHHQTEGNPNMLKAICPSWSCLWRLAQTLPQLHRRLHQAGTPGKAMQGQISLTHGKQTCLVQHSCRFRPFLA